MKDFLEDEGTSEGEHTIISNCLRSTCRLSIQHIPQTKSQLQLKCCCSLIIAQAKNQCCMTLSSTDRVVDHIFRLARCGNWGLKSIFHCLPATKTIRDSQPGRWMRRLCRNTTELFIVSTACTSFFPHVLCVPVEYLDARNTQQGNFVFYFRGPHLSSPSTPLFLSAPCFPAHLLCVSAWKWNRSFWILSSITEKKKKLSTCDAEQAKKKHRNMACLQQRWFREEECSILYAGRISLIEVSA